LHATGSGQFARDALLIPVNAQEAEEDDQQDDQNAGEVGDGSKVNRHGAGVDGQRRMRLLACPIFHAGRDKWLNDADETQYERDEQKPGLKVAPDGGGDQSNEDEDGPYAHPCQRAEKDYGQKQTDELAVAHHQQRGTHADEDWRGITQPADVPLAPQREKGNQKLEEEVSRDQHQFQHQRRVPQAVEARRTTCQLDEADGRLHEFMQGQPEILGVSLLRKVERQQKGRQDDEKSGVHQPRQPLKEAAVLPEFQLVFEISAIPEGQFTVRKERGVRSMAEGDVDCAYGQRDGGLTGGHVQVIEPRDCLVVLRRVAVRRFRLNLSAIHKNVYAGTGCAYSYRGTLGDGQFNEQRDRTMIRRQLDVQPEPGIALSVMAREGFWVAGCSHLD